MYDIIRIPVLRVDQLIILKCVNDSTVTLPNVSLTILCNI